MRQGPAAPLRSSAGRAWRAPTDALVVAALSGFAVLGLVAHGRVPGWRSVVLGNLAAAAVYLLAVGVAGRLRAPAGRAALRAAAVCGALAYLFSAVAPLQLVVHGRWLDGELIRAEQAVFGGQPTLWLQRITWPWLTELMMFAYVVYVLLYPLVCGAIWHAAGEAALEHCLLGLTVANVVCDVGFIAFPVAGPTYYMRDAFTVPLDGWLFTAAGELIRAKLHFAGGSLPSPHCAAATVLWAMALRYRHTLALALAPVVLMLYLSTFYCRYHYVSDAVAGIAVGAMAVVATNRLVSSWADNGGGR
jgi:hypothetical protein